MVCTSAPLVFYHHSSSPAAKHRSLRDGAARCGGFSRQRIAACRHILDGDDAQPQTGKTHLGPVPVYILCGIPDSIAIPFRQGDNRRGHVSESRDHQSGRSDGAARQPRAWSGFRIHSISANPHPWRGVDKRKEDYHEDIRPQPEDNRRHTDCRRTAVALCRIYHRQ